MTLLSEDQEIHQIVQRVLVVFRNRYPSEFDRFRRAHYKPNSKMMCINAECVTLRIDASGWVAVYDNRIEHPDREMGPILNTYGGDTNYWKPDLVRQLLVPFLNRELVLDELAAI